MYKRQVLLGPVAVAPAAGPADPDGTEEDMAAFTAGELEVAEIDNSVEARLLQAFPGAEEVV